MSENKPPLNQPKPPPELSGALLDARIKNDKAVKALQHRIDLRKARIREIFDEVRGIRSLITERAAVIRQNAVNKWVNKRRRALLSAMRKPDFALHESVMRIDTASKPTPPANT